MPGLGRSQGEGNGNPPQYSCLGNPMDKGAWKATVHESAELDTTEQLITHIWNVEYSFPGLLCSHHLPPYLDNI